uniref:Reverse transcriptase Ty1/copia-type domain-containing protein n=1 Tax=Cannabis sativa TaxID=3483 RepID=A0A803PMT6_CANSA
MHRDVVFNEKVMAMKPEDKAEISIETRQVQVEVRPEGKAKIGSEENQGHQLDLALQITLLIALTIVSDIENVELATYEEVVNCKNRDKWLQAIDEEKQSLTRLVAKGFTQIKEVDFNEIFSPVVKQASIRAIMAKEASEDLEIKQMEVKTTFFHGKLDETICMKMPEDFDEDKDNVCLLQNLWKSKSEIGEIKSLLNSEFEMEDLGEAKKILCIEIRRNRPKSLTLAQGNYLRKRLQKFKMDNSKPVSTPLAAHFRLSKDQAPKTEKEREFMDYVPYANGVESLMYAMVCTRPDIAYAMSIVSRFIAKPVEKHWDALKWIMRCIEGTLDLGLTYNKSYKT